MQWMNTQGHFWLKPPQEDQPVPVADPMRLQLGLELHPQESGEHRCAISNPDRDPLSRPFLSQDKTTAHQAATGLVADVRTLHQEGIRLGLGEQLHERKRALIPPDEMVSVLREFKTKPVLHGIEPRWMFSQNELSYDFDNLAANPLMSRLYRHWQSLFHRSIWKRQLIESIYFAEAVGDRNAMGDWHGVLQVIYFQLTVARLNGNCDLSSQGRKKQAQLKAGLVSKIVANFLLPMDSDLLHWKLGTPPRGGYRYWLRRLENSIQETRGM